LAHCYHLNVCDHSTYEGEDDIDPVYLQSLMDSILAPAVAYAEDAYFSASSAQCILPWHVVADAPAGYSSPSPDISHNQGSPTVEEPLSSSTLVARTPGTPADARMHFPRGTMPYIEPSPCLSEPQGHISGSCALAREQSGGALLGGHVSDICAYLSEKSLLSSCNEAEVVQRAVSNCDDAMLLCDDPLPVFLERDPFSSLLPVESSVISGSPPQLALPLEGMIHLIAASLATVDCSVLCLQSVCSSAMRGALLSLPLAQLTHSDPSFMLEPD
jgi:hypothetical protein